MLSIKSPIFSLFPNFLSCSAFSSSTSRTPPSPYSLRPAPASIYRLHSLNQRFIFIRIFNFVCGFVSLLRRGSRWVSLLKSWPPRSLFLSSQPPYNTMRLLQRRERFCFNVICALRALEYHLNYDLLQVFGFAWHFVSIITYHFTFASFLLCVFNSSCLNRKIKIGSKTLTKCVTSKLKRGVRRHHVWHQN